MQDEIFNGLLTSIRNNSFGEAELKRLQEDGGELSNDQVLGLVYALLINAKKHLYHSVLASKKLDISIIKLEPSVEEKPQNLLSNLIQQDFSRYGRYLTFSWAFLIGLNGLFLTIPLIIMDLRHEDWSRKIADFFAPKPLEVVLNEIEQTFKATVQDSAIEARLIGYSKWLELGQRTFIYRLIASIEKLEKGLSPSSVNEELNKDKIAFIKELEKQLTDYAQNPSVLAIRDLKDKLKFHIASSPEDSAEIPYKATLENALTWVKNQEIDILTRKNKIILAYFGVRQKHESLLASDKLNPDEKIFIRNLETDLIDYGNYPNNKLLETIKQKVTQELAKPDLNLVFKNNLSGVLKWAEIQKECIRENKEYFKELESLYQDLQVHGELMLPLYQGFDVHSGGGACFGYVAAWAKGLLEGGGQKPVFGTKPHEMPLFKLVDYSKVNLTSSELNNVFFVTPTIANLQVIQKDKVALSNVMSSTKEITYDKSIPKKKINQSDEKNMLVDNLIAQAESDLNPNKVYSLLLWPTTGSGHVVGIWRTAEGAYHFLDANQGWFRCEDKTQFKKWFNDYFPRVGYDKLYQKYQITSYSKTSPTLTETIKDGFIYKVAITIKNVLSSRLFPEKPSMQQGDLSANPETKNENSQQTHSLVLRALALEVRKQPHPEEGELKSATRLDALLDSQIAPKQTFEKQPKGDNFSRPVSVKSENKKEQIEQPPSPNINLKTH